MIWNPDLDVDAQLEDYAKKLYGPAAEPMEKFFRLASQRFEGVEWSGNSASYDAGLYDGLYGEAYTPGVIEELETYFNEALVAASVRPGGRARALTVGDRWLEANSDAEPRRYHLEIEGTRLHMTVGPGWWGGFLTIPGDLVGGLDNLPDNIRANFTRFRTAAPDEAEGPGESGAIELRMPAGATEPPAPGGGARYTWSPLIEGGLGWGRFPCRERGVLVFEK